MGGLPLMSRSDLVAEGNGEWAVDLRVARIVLRLARWAAVRFACSC
jgi:hypothetical protein